MLLTILFSLLILGFGALLVYSFCTHEDWAFLVGTFGFVISVAVSFCQPLGPDTITDSTAFSVEHTPYRVIVNPVELHERTWTDAYTVSRWDRIKAIRITTPHNMWGVELTNQRSFALVFND